MGYFIIGDRLETLPRGLLGKRRHSTERLTINVYRLSLACAAALGFERCRHGNDVCSLVCRTTALDF